jgi:hypothetical protein
MSQCREATGQRAADLANTDDANFHCSPPMRNTAGASSVLSGHYWPTLEDD